MSDHSPASSFSSSSRSSYEAGDNRIERIAGLHLDGDGYLRLGWEIQYLSSQKINPILLKVSLEGRFGRDGYGLSLIGNDMFQLWSPAGQQFTQTDMDSCEEASRDLNNSFRVTRLAESRSRDEASTSTLKK